MGNKSAINPGLYHLGITFDFPPYHNEEYRDENEIKQLRWKHAVMFNRRAYVGNVEMTSYDGNIDTLSDSIFKSRTNKFDSFSKDRRIDVAVGDGEDITALAHFADMLLQFKQTTLHIINCSGASEFLEGTYKFKGVDSPTAVCTTAYGVAWANKHGCFFFDGRQVQDILTRRSLRRISPTTWSTFTSTTIRAGFFPLENQVAFINDGGDWFIYDLVTQSLTRGTARVTTEEKTNLVNAWDGQLLLGSDSGSNTLNVHPLLAVGTDTSTLSSKNLEIVSRELDGGIPSSEKKWKKVYVTYRNAKNLEMFYNGVSKTGELGYVKMDSTLSTGFDLTDDCTFSDGSDTVTHTSDPRVKIGARLTGTGIPSNTYIKTITSGTVFVMSNNSTAELPMTNGTISFVPNGFEDSGDWNTTGFKVNVNAYSLKIKIVPLVPATSPVPYNFEINDLTFVFRTKTVK